MAIATQKQVCAFHRPTGFVDARFQRNKTPSIAAGQNQEKGTLETGSPAVLRAVELIDICAVVLAPLGFTEEGETPHVAPAGAPEQLKVTFWLNPLVPAIVSPMLVDCPAAMDTDDPEGSVSVKSAAGGGGGTLSAACR